MFRIRLSKFKQVIAVAIIPRIFVRDTKQIRNKLNNYHDVFNFARKSTDSGSKDDEIEKQRQIIEKCFGETPQPSESESESKNLKDHSSEMEKERRNIESSDFVRLSGAEKYDISNAPHNKPSQGLQAEEATVQATTANIAEETLDQRVETIDETPHVEASPQKNEGFNTTPKVLGHDIEFFADEKIQKIDLDDLAKRCVGAPIGNIDEMLIKEMKNMTNNDTKTETDVNLIKCHGVEKYYSGIFEIFAQTKTQKVDDTEKEPLCLFEENRSVGDKEIKSERITPLHVDAVHLFAFDEGLKDYKETGFFRGNSLNLSSEIEEPLLDVPNTISPYESRAMPFYEYDNKEQVDNLDESKTMYITETATDTRSKDIPRAEEVFFRKEDTDEPRLVIEKQEMDPVKSESNLSPTARPILVESKLKGHDNPSIFGNLSREQLLKLLYFYKSSTINETDKSHVFSTSTEIPSAAGINPSPNSSISGTNVPEIATKEANENMDMPVNSAISANQNPGEYYNMVLYEQQDSNLSQQQHSLTAENHIMQAFCTQLQEMQDGVPKETEDSIRVLEYPVLLRHPFSYILLEQDTIKNKVKEAPNNKVMATTIENVTDSIKNDATNADEVPLSQILKQIRDKNRLEFCQNLFLQNAKPERSKTFTCMAPLDSNKQKSSPRPCQPPPKPPKEKCPKPCPPPCPPKKDPCAKLIPFFLNTIINFDDLFDIQVPTIPLNSNYCYKTMLTDDVIARLRKLGESLRFVKLDTNYINDTTCAKDFEPWIPIPSWPAPKVEKKKPFVCPKEGCKPVPIPRSNLPKQRPCVGVPKKFFSEHKPVNTPDIIFIHL